MLKNMRLFAVAALLPFVLLACGPTEFEQGKDMFDKGFYEQAVPHLENAIEKNDNSAAAKKMIKESKVKIVEQKDQECLDKGENYVEMLKQTKVVTSWEKVMQELKQFRCRSLKPKPYIAKGYYNFISYLAEWDAYPQAVSKFCDFSGCEAEEARILIREEEISIFDEKGKEKTEIVQSEIPIADHTNAMEMFKWLVKKDFKNGRWFDRYAKMLWDTERWTDALEAYEAISQVEGLGYEIKSRAKISVEYLKKNRRHKRPDAEYTSFFWIEDAKKKSKLKGLKKDIEKAEKEKAEAEKAEKEAK